MTEERSNQTKRALLERLAEPYRARQSEDGNGHLMTRALERDAEVGDTYVLIVRDPGGKLVAMSRTPEPDPDAEREFRLDFLVEEKK